jgi:hypothetical protein
VTCCPNLQTEEKGGERIRKPSPNRLAITD